MKGLYLAVVLFSAVVAKAQTYIPWQGVYFHGDVKTNTSEILIILENEQSGYITWYLRSDGAANYTITGHADFWQDMQHLEFYYDKTLDGYYPIDFPQFPVMYMSNTDIYRTKWIHPVVKKYQVYFQKLKGVDIPKGIIPEEKVKKSLQVHISPELIKWVISILML